MRVMTNDDDELVPNCELPKRYNVSLTTVWRWKNDPAVNFPEPDAVIAGREYFRKRRLRKWENSTRKLTLKKPTHLRQKSETNSVEARTHAEPFTAE
jgi:hypothetical protein